MRLIDFAGAPSDATTTQRWNFLYVQIEGVGIGLSLAAGAFLPVFLTRLGASNLQVGLLTAMPGVTGFFLAIAAGRFLQTRRNIVPWFSIVRLLNISAYTLTGLVPFLVPRQNVVVAVLAIWAVVTVPQTLSGIAFSVVMSAVAGPRGRYALMSRRWSIMGLLNAGTVAVVGQILDATDFPINYQVVFLVLSLGGVIVYLATQRIKLPDAEPPPRGPRLSIRQGVSTYVRLVRGERAFVSFALRRFVFLSGVLLAAPLLPLYYVRDVEATDAWIGIISTTQTAVTLVGYYFWTRQSRVRGSRFVLLATTCVIALHPVMIGLTRRVELIVIIAALAGVFEAGLNLVFFDELMKTVPPEQAPIFVSLAQNLRYLSVVAGPLLGTALADRIGLAGGLFVGAAVRLLGFLLFAFDRGRRSLADARPAES